MQTYILAPKKRKGAVFGTRVRLREEDQSFEHSPPVLRAIGDLEDVFPENVERKKIYKPIEQKRQMRAMLKIKLIIYLLYYCSIVHLFDVLF